MKKINIIYWVITGLFLAMMLWSAISSLSSNPQGQKIMEHLHYPVYLGKLLGVAKILGVIAILTPGFPRLKEWAYAGFTFDLIGAGFGFISVGDPVTQWVFILVFLALWAVSYIYYHKKLKAAGVKDAVA